MLGDNLKRSNTRGTRKHEFKELRVDAVPSDRLDLNSQLATPLKRHKNDYLGGSSPVNIPLEQDDNTPKYRGTLYSPQLKRKDYAENGGGSGTATGLGNGGGGSGLTPKLERQMSKRSSKNRREKT